MPERAARRCRVCGEAYRTRHCPQCKTGWAKTQAEGSSRWVSVAPGDRRRYRKVRAVFLRDHPWCECSGCNRCFTLPSGVDGVDGQEISAARCARAATETDHVDPESMNDPARIADPDELMALCRSCHWEKTYNTRSRPLR